MVALFGSNAGLMGDLDLGFKFFLMRLQSIELFENTPINLLMEEKNS